MLDTLVTAVTHGAEVSSAVAQTPQTALAAILCAVLINLLG